MDKARESAGVPETQAAQPPPQGDETTTPTTQPAPQDGIVRTRVEDTQNKKIYAESRETTSKNRTKTRI